MDIRNVHPVCDKCAEAMPMRPAEVTSESAHHQIKVPGWVCGCGRVYTRDFGYQDHDHGRQFKVRCRSCHSIRPYCFVERTAEGECQLRCPSCGHTQDLVVGTTA